MIQKTAKLNYDKQYQWAVYYIRALQCAAGFVNITYFITGDGYGTESLCIARPILLKLLRPTHITNASKDHLHLHTQNKIYHKF